jgi:hypothetical protein
MRSLLKIGFALLLLAFALIGVSYSMLRAQGASGPSSPGSRLVASEKRVFAGAVALDVAGPINLTLRQGATPALEVRGEQRLLANIDTSVDGDTLHIGPRGILLRHRQPIEVSVTVPALERLTFNGSGENVVSGFAGERIALSLGGSGSVRFNGRYREIDASIHGSGDMEVTGGNSDNVKAAVVGSGQLTLVGDARVLVAAMVGSGELDARHLRSDDVALEHQGSGTSTVYARRKAAVALDGSGEATVHGNPDQRAVTRRGSGSVSFQD